MNQLKIEQLEVEIKDLHYHPKSEKLDCSHAETEEFYRCFWEIHVKPVVEYGKQMAVKYGADLEIVWLGALLHDIARLDEVEPHDQIGSDRAFELLVARGFDEVVAQKAREAVLRHRCRLYQPETLEQKIVASADAMAHFLPPFYLWMRKYSSKNWQDLAASNFKKIERDYRDKIFFDDERLMVEAEYQVLKKWFAY